MSDNSVPGCVGFHGRPISPNGPCNTCPYEDLCKSVIAKKRLKPLVDKILEMETHLEGIKID